jgi:hypothetical protein
MLQALHPSQSAGKSRPGFQGMCSLIRLFQSMDARDMPEIRRMPLEQTCLQLKLMQYAPLPSPRCHCAALTVFAALECSKSLCTAFWLQHLSLLMPVRFRSPCISSMTSRPWNRMGWVASSSLLWDIIWRSCLSP